MYSSSMLACSSRIGWPKAADSASREDTFCLVPSSGGKRGGGVAVDWAVGRSEMSKSRPKGGEREWLCRVS